MADFPAPVANQVKPPDPNQGINTFSSILGLQRQNQELQQGQYDIATSKATSEQANQKNLEMQAAQTYLRNGIADKSLLNPDGSVNRTKAADGLLQIAPTYGQEVSNHLISGANEMVNNKKALLDLGVDRQKALSGYFGAVAAKPDATQEDLLDATRAARGLSDDPAYQRMIDSNLLGFPQTHGMDAAQASAAIRQHAQVVANGAGAASVNDNNPNMATMQSPDGLQLYNSNPRYPGGIGPIGKPMKQGFSPSEKAESIDLGNGQRALLNRATGQYEIVQPAGRSQSGPSGSAQAGSGAATQPFGRDAQGRTLTASDNAPSPNAPRADQENYRAAAQAAREHVNQIRSQDDGYGNNMAVASEIRRLSDSTTTGPGTTTFNQWAGTLGTRVGVDVSDYQKLGAFLDRQSADLRKQMGLPGTNAGQETAAAISGNTEYQRGAIQAKNNYNESLTQGLHDYRQGLDRVEGYSGDANPKEVQRYRAAWTANFDPKAYEYKLAKQRGDTETANKILQDLTPQQAKGMAQKLRNLDRLTQGQLPQ